MNSWHLLSISYMYFSCLIIQRSICICILCYWRIPSNNQELTSENYSSSNDLKLAPKPTHSQIQLQNCDSGYEETFGFSVDNLNFQSNFRGGMWGKKAFSFGEMLLSANKLELAGYVFAPTQFMLTTLASFSWWHCTSASRRINMVTFASKKGQSTNTDVLKCNQKQTVTSKWLRPSFIYSLWVLQTKAKADQTHFETLTPPLLEDVWGNRYIC